ncbi:hypothetical protein [Streptomyces sp. NPDC127098]|uniref:hypothetical protein n=1 Tax=Streptomyces sp. NPDC127098 TaxID=3347137 RepID=UPI0036578583
MNHNLPHHIPQTYAQPQPTAAPATAIELAAERGVVWVPDAYGRGMVPITRDLAPAMPEPTPPRDLTPEPLIDPRAQILVGGGAGIGLASFGIAHLVSALTAFGTAGLAATALLILAAKMPGRRATGGGDTHITQHITATGWFGKPNGTIKHR